MGGVLVTNSLVSFQKNFHSREFSFCERNLGWLNGKMRVVRSNVWLL